MTLEELRKPAGIAIAIVLGTVGALAWLESNTKAALQPIAEAVRPWSEREAQLGLCEKYAKRQARQQTKSYDDAWDDCHTSAMQNSEEWGLSE